MKVTQSVDISNLIITPKNIPEIYVNKDKERMEKKDAITKENLMKIQVKIKPVTSWDPIWTTEGIGSRTEISIWAQQSVSRILYKRNKLRLSLGHYAVPNTGKKGFASFHTLRPPSNLKGFTIELTDLRVSTISRSGNLDETHVNYLLPYPIQYKIIWWHQSEENSVYIWKPIPPSSNYIALGCVATRKNEPPPVDAVRCINKGFLKPSKTKKQHLWDNSGVGGKKGSFWITNSLGLLSVTEGYDAPQSDAYDPRDRVFIAGTFFIEDPKDAPLQTSGNHK